MDGINIFMPGQRWLYDTRDGEEQSTLTVLTIDELEDDAIIHIRVDGLILPGTTSLEHLPFSADALMASVTEFDKHLDQIPAFTEGYTAWKQAFDSGKGGYWKQPVKTVIAFIAARLQTQQSQSGV